MTGAHDRFPVSPAERQTLCEAEAILDRSQRAYGVFLDLPENTALWLRLQLQFRDREVFIGMFLDPQRRLIRCEELQVGSFASIYVYPREIVKAALASGATSVVFAHNHPSGNTSPSRADLDTAPVLKYALSAISVYVDDFLIVGDTSAVYSFRDHGHAPFDRPALNQEPDVVSTLQQEFSMSIKNYIDQLKAEHAELRSIAESRNLEKAQEELSAARGKARTLSDTWSATAEGNTKTTHEQQLRKALEAENLADSKVRELAASVLPARSRLKEVAAMLGGEADAQRCVESIRKLGRRQAAAETELARLHSAAAAIDRDVKATQIAIAEHRQRAAVAQLDARLSGADVGIDKGETRLAATLETFEDSAREAHRRIAAKEAEIAAMREEVTGERQKLKEARYWQARIRIDFALIELRREAPIFLAAERLAMRDDALVPPQMIDWDEVERLAVASTAEVEAIS